MPIKRKAFIILVAVFLTYSIVHFAIQRFVIYPGFVSLEREEATKNVQRITNAIFKELEHLNNLCHDWAAWDNTYNYVESPNSDYIESNLHETIFIDNHIDFIAISNNAGEIVWRKAFDAGLQKTVTIESIDFQKSPYSNLKVHNPNGKPLSQVKKMGLLATQDGSLLFSSRPIITSSNRGPIKGAFMMGKFLDDEMIESLTGQVNVDFKVSLYSNTIPDIDGIRRTDSGESTINLEEISVEKLKGTAILNDIFKRPRLKIEAVIERRITQSGRQAIRSASILILAISLSSLFLVLVLIHRIVLRPVSQLTDQFTQIQKTGILVKVDSDDTNDEIGLLRLEFNNLLEQLRTTRRSLLDQSYYTGMGIMAEGILHNLRNTLTPLLGQLGLLREKIFGI